MPAVSGWSTPPVSFIVTGASATALPGLVVGYQPNAGETYDIHVRDCYGDVRPDLGSAMAFETIVTVDDAAIQLSFHQLTMAGADPVDIATLRELTAYPSTYDRSAVYLGEFDFAVRRNLTNSILFLSVWNEQIEESVRGPNVNNVNTLFVSVVPAAGVTQAQIEQEIRLIVGAADSSLKVRYIPAVFRAFNITVNAWISVVHDPVLVQAQVKQAILSKYGQGTVAAKRGMTQIQHRAVKTLLEQQIVALQDDGADFQVLVGTDTPGALPENWRYVDANSITVNVQTSTYNLGNWGR